MKADRAIAALEVVTCDSTGDPDRRNGGPKSYTLNVQEISLDVSSMNFGPADITVLAAWIQRPEVSAALEVVNVLGACPTHQLIPTSLHQYVSIRNPCMLVARISKY